MAVAAGIDCEAAPARTVVDGAFRLLTLLHGFGSARVSELQRVSGLPRTTVHRLLAQLERVGAVERSAGRWRIGPRLIELGAHVPAEPRLRSVARRPLMDLANVSGALVGLSVEMAGRGMVVDVLPGTRRLPYEPQPGSGGPSPIAALRAHERARCGDLRPVVDAGVTDRRVSCIAAPLRLSPRDAGAVWLMTPGGAGVPAAIVAATRRTAARIASQLPARG
jgi:hypothetical protein